MNDSNSNDSNALFDLIQNIQSKLNDEQNENSNENNNNIEKNNENNNFNNQNFDFSSIISMLGNNSNSNNSNTSYTDNSNNSFDMNTILRLQKIFSSLNGNDPKKNLLLSLKPFLRKSRQDKINEYITLLTISDALGIFNSRGENKNE